MIDAKETKIIRKLLEDSVALSTEYSTYTSKEERDYIRIKFNIKDIPEYGWVGLH